MIITVSATNKVPTFLFKVS